MSTLLASITDIPVWAAPSSLQTINFRIRLITPMFGGGVVPGVVDISNPIRAASIRGHLRFWWRATAGSQFRTPQDLYEAEAALWGSTQTHGKVVTRAALEPVSRDRFLREAAKDPDQRNRDSCLLQCAVYKQNRDNTGYVAFPDPLHGFPLYALQPFVGARGKDRNTLETEPAFGLVDVEFDLTLLLHRHICPYRRGQAEYFATYSVCRSI